jgi:hypothetical protein
MIFYIFKINIKRMNITKILIIGNNYAQINAFGIRLKNDSYFPIYYEWILTNSIENLKNKYLNHDLIILLDSNVQIPPSDFNVAVFNAHNIFLSDHKYIHTFKNMEEICLLIGKIYIKGGLIEKEKKKIELSVQIPKDDDYIIPFEQLSSISTPINRICSITPIH